jgi:alpha-amylase
MIILKKISLAIFLFMLNLTGSFSQNLNSTMVSSHGGTSEDEIIYHVFLRSFYDSNGDLHGDFNGLREKLSYLQQLGVTSILVPPICSSPYYHNYFSDDFEKTDSRFGTNEDWISLVREIHKRGMKIYLDVEFQYVIEDHPWYKDSYGHPKSTYGHYILFDDSLNEKPESIIYNITELKGYDGISKKVATVNLYNEDVQQYFFNLLKYWMDPNGDGKFDDGVDGFRFDHMMDDLDWKGKLTDLFNKFWNPLIEKLKQVNPAIKNVAEQANWSSYGVDYFEKADLQMAIASFDARKISEVADSTFSLTPDGKEQVVFIENHDMKRFASAVNQSPGKLRIGAALNLLIGGIPSIYYGQELGMVGSGGFGKYGMTDANDIPQREAFEWFKADSGKGMALWYKNTGPWWNQTNLKPNDGISLQEEKNDSASLWNFYRKLIQLRKNHPSLVHGKYETLTNNNDSVLSFLRTEQNENALVVINLTDQPQNVSLDFSGNNLQPKNLHRIFGKEKATVATNEKAIIHLPEYGIEVYLLQ